jgi:hypothetical protein
VGRGKSQTLGFGNGWDPPPLSYGATGSISGKMPKNLIRIVPGGKVEIEI